MLNRRKLLIGFEVWSCLALLGCERTGTESGAYRAVPIAAGAECAVCGMTVTEFPGPKGEIFVQGQERPLFFCSTRDLFAHALQPESRAVMRALYVHDMGATSWESPEDSALTEARSAWYVVGHRLRGAMGPTLASFKERSAAEAFAHEQGGQVIGFGEVTLELLAGLG